MDKYVTSREWSEKLKAAGYDQFSTQYVWFRQMPVVGDGWDHKLMPRNNDPLNRREDYAAPLSDELLKSEGIPDGLIIHSNREDGDIVYYGGMVFHGRWRDNDGWHQSLANALAELWLWNHGDD